MQKVEGSSPFSRFYGKPRYWRGFSCLMRMSFQLGLHGLEAFWKRGRLKVAVVCRARLVANYPAPIA